MSRSIEILLAIRQGKIGGGESHVLDLVSNLDLQKYKPIVLSFTDGELINNLNKLGIENYVINSTKPFDVFVWRKVKRLIKRSKIKLVHGHGTRAISNVWWAARKLRIPLLYTVHGWSFHPDQNLLVKYIRRISEEFLVKKSDLTVLVSQSNKTTGSNILKGSKCIVIKNGVNQEKFDFNKKNLSLRSEFGFKPEDIVVGYIVRLTIQKDPISLIKAFYLVNKSCPNAKLLVVGDGELKAPSISLSKELQIENAVVFTGFRTDVPAILSSIDIFCLPSLWEGLPIGLLEAMSMRKPTVASDVDGTSELIVNQVNGILVPPRSPEKLADAIIELVENRQLRDKIASAGFATINSEYRIASMVKKVEEVYDSFI